MTITPSMLEVHTAVMSAAFSSVHTCMPAEIVRVHEGAHKRQFVDVLPGLQRQVYGEDGELVNETLPIVPMVPVAYMHGGGFFISVPLLVGDVVLLVFAERSLDQWIETAKKNSKRAIVPGDVGMHTLEGAIALPCGPAPRSALLDGVDGVDLVIARVGGPQLRITPSGIVRIVGDLEVTGEVTAKAGTVDQRKLTNHGHNTSMGPSGPPNPPLP